MYFFANFLFMLVAFTQIELEISLFHNVYTLIDKGDKNLIFWQADVNLQWPYS